MSEKTEILDTLSAHRRGLRGSMAGLTDADAAEPTTAGELCLGAILQHVRYAETMWIDFLVDGYMVDDGQRHAASSRIEPGETPAVLLERYAAAARRTDEVVGARLTPPDRLRRGSVL